MTSIVAPSATYAAALIVLCAWIAAVELSHTSYTVIRLGTNSMCATPPFRYPANSTPPFITRSSFTLLTGRTTLGSNVFIPIGIRATHWFHPCTVSDVAPSTTSCAFTLPFSLRRMIATWCHSPLNRCPLPMPTTSHFRFTSCGPPPTCGSATPYWFSVGFAYTRCSFPLGPFTYSAEYTLYGPAVQFASATPLVRIVSSSSSSGDFWLARFSRASATANANPLVVFVARRYIVIVKPVPSGALFRK